MNLKILQKSIVKNLIKTEGLSSENAQKIYESCFCMYFSSYMASMTNATKELEKYFNRSYALNLFPSWYKFNDDKVIKEILKVSFRLRFVFEKYKCIFFRGEVLQNEILNKRTDLLLPSLLNHKSKYHKSFMPIYKLVTSKE